MQVGSFHDVSAGTELMSQGAEIESVHLLVDGLCKIEEERRIAVQKDEGSRQSGAAAAVRSAPTGAIVSSSPSLLSYVFGSAADDGPHSAAAQPVAADRQQSDHAASGGFAAADGATLASAPAAAPDSGSFPPQAVLASVVQQVTALGENVRELLSGHQDSGDGSAKAAAAAAQHSQPDAVSSLTAEQLSGAGAPAASSSPASFLPSSSPSQAPASPATGALLSPSLSSRPGRAEISAAASESASPSPSAAVAESVSERRKARKERRRRERSERAAGGSAAGGGGGLPSSSSLSADGEWQIVRQVIGYLKAGRLIGEMSLLTTQSAASAASSSPSAASLAAPASPSSASLSPTIGSATVTCVESCRLLSWRRDDLRSLFFRLPTLSVGWYAIVSSDLVHRLSEARHLSLRNGYKLLLLGCCSEGRVTAKQKAAAEEYRRLNSISDAAHLRCLADIGWTEEDWRRGSQGRSWMEQIAGQARQWSSSSSSRQHTQPAAAPAAAADSRPA
jgi:CRP-like cAMP-binding protein